jgi:hypothetical protein
MKAKIKNYNVFSVKKGEIVEILKEYNTYCICSHSGGTFRVEKRDLQIIKK